VGLATYQVGVKGRPFYIPVTKIEEYVAAFKANKESVRAEEEARAVRRTGNRALSRTPRGLNRPGL
ncbi:MAG: hypothetical protein K2X47_10240, partial [Bdellovibrionales bacterium]|nr:hypothetical protein [Bdellovibrionales bacterium]